MSSVPDPWGERLPRRIGIFSAGAVLVGSTIGSGIFRSPAEIAGHLNSPALFFLVWVVGGLVALAGALTFAELAAMFPRTGGMYVYLREAFGPLPAFLFGWAELVILRPAAYAAIALICAEYLWVLLGQDTSSVSIGPMGLAPFTGALLILGVGMVNYRGILLGALIQNASTVLKISALLGLITLGVACPIVAPPAPISAPTTPDMSLISSFGLALVAVLWAYDGWSDVGFVSGEVRDPERVLPRAFVLGTAVVVVLYLAINAVYAAVIPVSEMAGRPLIAADVARALLGNTGAMFVAAAVMVSTFGTLNGSMMTGPRVFFAMAEDGLFFRSLAVIHPRHGTPSRAISLSIALGMLFVSVRGFGELADQFVIGIWPFYALSVAAVIVLRRKRPDAHRPYRCVGYPFVPLAFLAATVFLLGSYLIREPWLLLADVAVLAAGVPVYALLRIRKSAAR